MSFNKIYIKMRLLKYLSVLFKDLMKSFLGLWFNNYVRDNLNVIQAVSRGGCKF